VASLAHESFESRHDRVTRPRSTGKSEVGCGAAIEVPESEDPLSPEALGTALRTGHRAAELIPPGVPLLEKAV
jgi:hypothetical protein